MGPWDDVEVDPDGDELLDWLWDFPERYDVGIDGDPNTTAGPADGTVGGVRTRGRTTDDAGAPAAFFDDQPTFALPTLDTGQTDASEVGYPVWADGGARSSRFSARDVAAVVAMILVVAVGLGLGYVLFKGSGKTPKPSNLAVASPITTIFNQSLIPPLDTTPSTADTTTSIPDTTVPTSSSVPAVVVGATTSTTRRSTTTVAVTTTTTTTTTVPPTTTSTSTTTTSSTSSTVPSWTTSTAPGSTTTSTSAGGTTTTRA